MALVWAAATMSCELSRYLHNLWIAAAVSVTST
jgi:hypothetical protein